MNTNISLVNSAQNNNVVHKDNPYRINQTSLWKQNISNWLAFGILHKTISWTEFKQYERQILNEPFQLLKYGNIDKIDK